MLIDASTLEASLEIDNIVMHLFCWYCCLSLLLLMMLLLLWVFSFFYWPKWGLLSMQCMTRSFFLSFFQPHDSVQADGMTAFWCIWNFSGKGGTLEAPLVFLWLQSHWLVYCDSSFPLPTRGASSLLICPYCHRRDGLTWVRQSFKPILRRISIMT